MSARYFGLFIALFLYFAILSSCSKNEVNTVHNERYYQTKLCDELNGITEYRLKDNSRVDCLTNEYAIEVDWAKKWAEGVGQSLFYAEMTGKKPAIGLIIGDKDQRHLKRLNSLKSKLGIKVYEIKK